MRKSTIEITQPGVTVMIYVYGLKIGRYICLDERSDRLDKYVAISV